MSARKYLILCAIVVLSACGDTALSRGMKDVPNISLENWPQLFTALASPWIVGGILLLIGFMATYTTALSWADLTYVLPATSLGYVLMAIFGSVFLHEIVTPKRWLGILLITAGVGFVAGGPSVTEHPAQAECEGVPAGVQE